MTDYLSFDKQNCPLVSFELGVCVWGEKGGKISKIEQIDFEWKVFSLKINYRI